MKKTVEYQVGDKVKVNFDDGFHTGKTGAIVKLINGRRYVRIQYDPHQFRSESQAAFAYSWFPTRYLEKQS